MLNPITNDTAGVFLINIMAASPRRQDLLEHFKIQNPANGITLVEVEMKINGVEVDFSRSVTDMWNRLHDCYEEDVIEKATELVGMSKLDRLASIIREAEQEIESEIRTLFNRNV